MKQKSLLTCLFTFLLMASFAQTSTDKVYRASVSFHSFAAGVPSSKPLTDYIAKFKKANKIKKPICADRIGPLGREGEYKLAFSLRELTKKQQLRFIAALKKVVAGMKDRGQAELLENDQVISASLPSMATVVVKKF